MMACAGIFDEVIVVNGVFNVGVGESGIHDVDIGVSVTYMLL
jgi:hypothetical protein